MTSFEIFSKIHKFLTSYKVIQYKLKNKIVQIPEFLIKVPWNCDSEHLIDKWVTYCYSIPFLKAYKFYDFLDNENKEIFINWIIENE